ncbi:MAG: competence protein ComEC, partial [Chloroflexota bacterium]|nr:competence protein ComEC [Chloroflexota bacterium]
MRATLVRPRLASIPLLAGCFTAAIIAVEVAAPAPRGVVVGAQLTLIVCLGAAIAVAALRRRFAWPLLIVAALALGSWRGAAALATTLQPWSGAPSVPIEMVGSVEQPPEPRGSTLAVLVRPAEITNPAGIAAPAGLVQLALPALEPVDYGDRLVIVGQFQPVEGGASSGRRQLASGVVATSLLPATAVIGHNGGNSALAALFAFRQRLQGAAAASLPEPYATLVMGMILGIVGGVPDSLRLGLVASGTTHMLVVSGYNISLVAAALRRSFGRIRGTRLLVPLVGVWAFTLMTGAGAPSLRAALMATVALAARGTGRGRDALAALVLACALMLGFDPLLATNLGFELSALATLGLIALEPRVAALLTRLSPVLREPLAATLAAELATSPLLATTFHQVTPASPIANAVLAPLVPIITVAGAGLLPLVAILPFLAPLAGLILFVPSWAFVEVVTLTAAIPRVVQPVGEIPAGILVLYAAALLVWAGWATPEGQDLRAKLAGAPLARRAGYGAAAGLIAAIVL